MAESILKLNNLTKTYILGTRKNARKAQKELQQLHKRYEKELEKKRCWCCQGNRRCAR